MATKQTTRQKAREVRAFWQLIGDLEPSEAEYIADQVNVDLATHALLDAMGDRVPPGRAVIAVEPYLELAADEAVHARRVTPEEMRAWVAGKLPIPGVVARVLLHRVLDEVINEGGDFKELPFGVVAHSRRDEALYPKARVSLRRAGTHPQGFPQYLDTEGQLWVQDAGNGGEQCHRCGADVAHVEVYWYCEPGVAHQLVCPQCVEIDDLPHGEGSPVDLTDTDTGHEMLRIGTRTRARTRRALLHPF